MQKDLQATGATGPASSVTAKSVTVRAGYLDLVIVCGNITWQITYTCGSCLVACSAVTGWGYKKATTNRCHHWGCMQCWKNWQRESPAAVTIHMQIAGKS